MPSLRQEITKTFLRLSRSVGRHPPSADAPPREGRQFGSYKVIKRLGRGGMGEVYLALDTRLGRYAALKFLPPEMVQDERALYRFQQEARTASALNHPNIVTIYDLGEMDGEQFIATEFIDGATLRQAIDRGAVNVPMALDVAAQVASALMAAHSAGVVHRDLKPTNIMIRADGYVKVIDFGLAKLGQRSFVDGSFEEALTRPGAVLGTIDYMSPEQARAIDIDHRTDLWSLGVILYEMVSRRRPFDGETESHIIVGILDKAAPPFERSLGLPLGLQAVVDRALVKDRARRYQAAVEMLSDLRELTGAPSRSRTGKIVAAPRRLTFRLKHAWIAAVIALIMAAGAVWWWGFNGRYAVLGPDWFQIASIEQVTHNGNVGLATISPDGQYLAYVSGAPGEEILQIRSLRTGAENRLPSIVDRFWGLTFSPDSKSVYYVSADRSHRGRLYSTTIFASVPKLILEDIIGPISFSPDGSQFAFVRRYEENGANREAILIASANDARNAHIIASEMDTEIKSQIAWSSNGQSIAAILFGLHLSESTHPVLSLFSTSGIAIKQVSFPQLRSAAFPLWVDRGRLLLFSGVAQNSTDGDKHIEQFFVPMSESHGSPGTPAFDSISVTGDGRTVAAVRLDQHSSIWLRDLRNAASARKLAVLKETISSLDWLQTDELVIPSERRGSLDLWGFRTDGTWQPVFQEMGCLERQPAVFPDGSSMVYSSNCAEGGSDFNLWRLDLKTGRRVQLTSGSNFDEYPRVTPDGKWVVYTSWPSNSPSIYKISSEGGVPVRLTPLQAVDPDISPDGESIVCEVRDEQSRGAWHVAVMSFPDGKIQKELEELPFSGPVRWSPDGNAVEYVETQDGTSHLLRRSLRGGPSQELANSQEGAIAEFRWNRDGTKLAYVVSKAENDAVLLHRRP